MKNNQQKSNRGGRRVGAGRPAGTPNKFTGELKAMVLQALEEAGGVEYLKSRAVDTPNAFLSLLGRVLPMQVTGEGGGPILVEATWLAGRSV